LENRRLRLTIAHRTRQSGDKKKGQGEAAQWFHTGSGHDPADEKTQKNVSGDRRLQFNRKKLYSGYKRCSNFGCVTDFAVVGATNQPVRPLEAVHRAMVPASAERSSNCPRQPRASGTDLSLPLSVSPNSADGKHPPKRCQVHLQSSRGTVSKVSSRCLLSLVATKLMTSICPASKFFIGRPLFILCNGVINEWVDRSLRGRRNHFFVHGNAALSEQGKGERRE
jgi:hypothetical protein